MEVSEVEEVKHLRDENSRLKKKLADSSAWTKLHDYGVVEFVAVVASK
jgi:hypothetical protein